MKTLLQGRPYVPAARTNIKLTFARIRRELRDQQRETVLKVTNIRKKETA